jgi:hypothetical protein
MNGGFWLDPSLWPIATLVDYLLDDNDPNLSGVGWQ